MATCPRCRSKKHMTLQPTGHEFLTAAPVGTFSLAGATTKFPVRALPELLLACDPAEGGCGWEVRGYEQGTDLIVHDGPTTKGGC